MSLNSDESEEEIVFPLGKLPCHILEHILRFIPENDLAHIAATNKTFLYLVNKIIREKIFQMFDALYTSLEKLRLEINSIPKRLETLEVRAKCLRSYFTMEMLLSEISIIRPLCRDILFGNEQHKIHVIGPLIYEVESLFQKAKQKTLPPWTVNCELTLKIARCTKLFSEHILEGFDTENHCGSFIIDLVNLIINKQYKITVQYYPLKESCDIHVVYVYENPQKIHHFSFEFSLSFSVCGPKKSIYMPNFKFLSCQKMQEFLFLSRLPRFTESENTIVNSVDKKSVLLYLISLVRINNRIILREEQFLRESELTVRAQLTTHGLSVPPTNWLFKDVRTHKEWLPNPSREIIMVDEHFLIQEEYTSPSYRFEIDRRARILKKKNLAVPVNCVLRCLRAHMKLKVGEKFTALALDEIIKFDDFLIILELRKGVRFVATMRCSINQMPLIFITCWKRLLVAVKTDLTQFQRDIVFWRGFQEILKEKDIDADDLSLGDFHDKEPEDINLVDYQYDCSLQVMLDRSARYNNEGIVTFSEN